MTEKTKKHIHLIYDIVLCALLIVAGICLMISCVGIYRAGDKPFTPASVAAAFQGIAVPVYLCLALVAGSFVLEGVLPRSRKKALPQKQYDAIARRLRQTRDADADTAVCRERKLRKTLRVATLALLAAGSIAFLCYGLNPANFHQSEITASMERAMYVLLPCMAVPFGFSVFSAYAHRASLRREIALMKQAPQREVPLTAAVSSGDRRLLITRSIVLGIAVFLLVFGFFAGGTKDVLTKAVNICTECVGLG